MNEPIVTDMEKEFETILEELKYTFKAKNSDYGNAVDITYLMFGDTAQLVRLWDKLLRITQLILSGKANVQTESVEDTLADLANYAIIALAQRRVYVDNAYEDLGKIFSVFITNAVHKKNN